MLTAMQVDKMLLELAAISVRYIFIQRCGLSPDKMGVAKMAVDNRSSFGGREALPPPDFPPPSPPFGESGIMKRQRALAIFLLLLLFL